MSVVHIPEPCPQQISSMTAVDGGYYCGSCCKVVVDFTSKTDQELVSFFSGTSMEGTCGRFRNSQLKPKRNFSFETVRFAAAVLMVFGSFLFSSCDSGTTIGELMPNDSIVRADSIAALQQAQKLKTDSTGITDSLHGDTIGMMVPVSSKSVK